MKEQKKGSPDPLKGFAEHFNKLQEGYWNEVKENMAKKYPDAILPDTSPVKIDKIIYDKAK